MTSNLDRSTAISENVAMSFVHLTVSSKFYLNKLTEGSDDMHCNYPDTTFLEQKSAPVLAVATGNLFSLC